MDSSTESLSQIAVPGFLQPSTDLTDEIRQRDLKALTFQAVAASGADGLMSSGFLAAFALLLGASNFHLGILTALPFIMHQIASSIRYTVEGIAFGADTAKQAQARIIRAVAGASQESRDISRQGAVIAFGATQGSMRAIAKSGFGVGRLVKNSVRGALTAVSRAGGQSADAR